MQLLKLATIANQIVSPLNAFVFLKHSPYFNEAKEFFIPPINCVFERRSAANVEPRLLKQIMVQSYGLILKVGIIHGELKI